MEQNTLEELKNFEKQEQNRLEQMQAASLKDIEKANKDIDKRLKETKEELLRTKDEEVKVAKEKAGEKAKEVASEYKGKIGELEIKSSKNFKGAVDKIFSVIFNKNV